MKKKAEKERNLLDQKFADLRQLIIMGGAGERALLLDMQKILEGTEEHGEIYILNINQGGINPNEGSPNEAGPSKITTQCLVSAHGERLSSAKGVSRRSSWSPPHLLDRRMEENATVGDWEGSGETEGQKKKKRARSKSVGFHEDLEVHEVHDVHDEDLSPRVTSSVPDTMGSNEGGGTHNMEEKTILKSEKCGLCGERMKFGKVGLRCSKCRLF